MIIKKPEIEILSETSYEELLKKVERAGRVCYKSEGNIKEGSAETFIRGILKRGHESVVEHGSITVRIVCDRGRDPMRLCATELPATVRRAPGTAITPMRKFGSQITCIDLASGFQYDLNDEKDRRKYEIWKKAMEEAERYYFDLLEAGAKPEEARSILPNSLKTEIVVTMDIREWRHFIRLRGGHAAHPQIREITKMILEEFSRRYPVFFDDLKIEE